MANTGLLPSLGRRKILSRVGETDVDTLRKSSLKTCRSNVEKSSAMGQEFGCECPNAAVRSQPEPQQPAAEVDSLGWSCGHRSAKVAAPVAPKWMIPATGSHYFALGQSMGLMGPGSCRTNELNLADGPLGVQSSASGATCPSANPGHRRLSLSRGPVTSGGCTRP